MSSPGNWLRTYSLCNCLEDWSMPITGKSLFSGFCILPTLVQSKRQTIYFMMLLSPLLFQLFICLLHKFYFSYFKYKIGLLVLSHIEKTKSVGHLDWFILKKGNRNCIIRCKIITRLWLATRWCGSYQNHSYHRKLISETKANPPKH